MRDGDTLRFVGPNGAPFVVTVGPAFPERLIRSYVESGEWTPVEEPTTPEPEPEPEPARKTAPPRKRPAAKPKS